MPSGQGSFLWTWEGDAVKYNDAILALDVGVTTGYAVIWPDGSVVETGAIDAELLRYSLEDLLERYKPVRVLVEPPVIVRGTLGTILGKAMEVVRSLAPNAEEVQPSQWKATPWAKISPPEGVSVHERDAYRMGCFALKTHLQGR